ncbi:hypothetical protein L1S35_03915 [Flavobacterium sp. AS60]|uniref:hypothetical protein n=1 Tax=Flavobacterium anseongense TaxID=2910677 RepID=UPI001F226ED3|nr:hypothetical protein [Flavobacterium sp. AS60]MCF6128804.1 hypothetical protein [Flavobacterium sp. AS60]
MSKFQDILIDEVDDLITLPLLHTCDAHALREILASMTLIPKLCDVFSLDLLYTYYGLPSYRPNYDKATTNPAYYMICIILESEKLNDFHKIYPFDSGAFEKLPEMKETFFHHNTKILDFELDSSISSAKKVIKTFYETNDNYLYHNPKTTKKFSQFDFEAISYSNLIGNQTNSKLDDRTSSIEIIFDKPINLNKETIKQIIIPNCFKDDTKITDLIKTNFDIDEPIGYNTFRGNPKEYFSIIRNEYLNFLKN